MSQQTDLLLSKRYGDFKAAEKCRDRAIEWLKLGKKLEAIDQLHSAKIRWFADETIRGSLLSMMIIAQSYQEIGLLFASKYYALAAASMAINSKNSEIKHYASKSLNIAAECDYLNGAWASYMELVEIALITEQMYGKEASNSEGDIFGRTLFYIATMTAVMSILDPEIHLILIDKINEFKINDQIKDLLSVAYSSWQKRNKKEIWASMESTLLGRPFEDFGKLRRVTWSELGIIWEVLWENNYENTAASEEMISILQILLADLAQKDLCLMKTSVEIHVSRGNVSQIQISPIASNIGRKWNIVLPNPAKRYSATQNNQFNILPAAIVILNEISLLPYTQFLKIIEDRFKNGISMKVFVVKPYENLYREFISKKRFDSINRSGKKIPIDSMVFKIRENTELPWRDGPGPGYSKQKANQFLKNRYKRTLPPIKYTLKNLLKNEEFRKLVQKLRKEGWLDWHILNSINNLAIQHRVQKQLGPYPPPSPEIFISYMKKIEKRTDKPIPIEVFSEEAMRMSQKASMVSTLTNLNLEIHQRTPDFAGIEHFLAKRYNYWTDDIPHKDPFS